MPARARASAELRRDPARSDYVIAIAASCARQQVAVFRRDLENAGQIPRVPPARRIQRPRLTPFASRARTALRAGAQLPEQLMQFGLSYSAACAALSRARAEPGRHAPRPAEPPQDRQPRHLYAPPDEIEWPCCTAEWRDGAFRHERSCPRRAAATG
jgi:hypothetical protein